jgi:hypothetical protein
MEFLLRAWQVIETRNETLNPALYHAYVHVLSCTVLSNKTPRQFDILHMSLFFKPVSGVGSRFSDHNRIALDRWLDELHSFN